MAVRDGRFSRDAGNSSASCSQPIPLPGDQILVSKGYGVGARLAQIERDANENFGAKLLWEKTVLKTKLSNLVIRNGHAYGLDHTFLSCVEITSGRVKWKKRRSPDFGHGQVLLVGDKLLVTTESGEGVLVECTPIDNRTYRALRSVSRSTAQRELSALATAGAIVLEGIGRGARYRPAPPSARR